jgi:methionyl-tRNA formyltransferase
MKVGILAVGKKGIDVLNGLAGKIEIEFIQTYDDKNVKDNSYNEIVSFAKENDIHLIIGKRLDFNTAPDVDKAILIGWQYLLDVDSSKLIVIHDSRLPEYKGWAPTVNYLINGSDYVAATAIQPTGKMDTGPIYKSKFKYIQYPIKIKDALKIVSDLYVEIIQDIVNGDYKITEMENSFFATESFCLWRDSEDYYIDWSQDAEMIERFVNAVGEPYAGARFRYEGGDFIVMEAEAKPELKTINPKNHLGKVLMYEDEHPIVVCGNGCIKLTKIKSVKWAKVMTFDKVKIRLK